MRPKVSRRSMNGATYGVAGSPTCILKSPVMIISEGEEMKSSRSEVNSEMKVVLDKDGGR